MRGHQGKLSFMHMLRNQLLELSPERRVWLPQSFRERYHARQVISRFLDLCHRRISLVNPFGVLGP